MPRARQERRPKRGKAGSESETTDTGSTSDDSGGPFGICERYSPVAAICRRRYREMAGFSGAFNPETSIHEAVLSLWTSYGRQEAKAM